MCRLAAALMAAFSSGVAGPLVPSRASAGWRSLRHPALGVAENNSMAARFKWEVADFAHLKKVSYSQGRFRPAPMRRSNALGSAGEWRGSGGGASA
jgi:hypothetical protein